MESALESYYKIVKSDKFPNDLLLSCYNFYQVYKNKPKNYMELFEFCKVKEIEGLMQEYVKRLAKLTSEGER